MAIGKNGGTQVNRAELAALFGVSLPTVDSWVRQPGFPVVERGAKGREWVFDAAAVIAWKAAKAVSDATGDANQQTETELQRRRMVADTGRAELAFLKEKGEVAPLAEFEAAWAKSFAELQTNILNVPQRVVIALLGETDETRFKAVLRSELVAALTQTAEAPITLDDDENPEE